MVETQYKYNLNEGMDIDNNFIETVLLEEEQAKGQEYCTKFLSS